MTREAQVRSRVWKQGKVVAENIDFEQISEFADDEACLLWFDLDSDPDASQLTRLADELSLESIVVEAAVAEHERPKIYYYDTFRFVTAYSVDVDAASGGLNLSRISAFVTRNALITVRPEDRFELDPLLTRWDELKDLYQHGPNGLLYGLLDLVVDGHFDAVQQLDDAFEDLEDGLFAERPEDRATQQRTFALRKTLVRLRRVVLPMREVVGGLLRRDEESDTALRPYFDDLYDHVLRVTEWTESLRDMITSIFETNLSLADARLNTIMKKLTSWAAIIAVPTLVTGFYGQNIPYPGFGHDSGLIVSSVIMVVAVVALYLVFRRKDWL